MRKKIILKTEPQIDLKMKKNYLINTHKTNSLNIYYSSKSNK